MPQWTGIHILMGLQYIDCVQDLIKLQKTCVCRIILNNSDYRWFGWVMEFNNDRTCCIIDLGVNHGR